MDNSSSEAWAQKGSHVSFTGRALGRLQASLLMRSAVGLCTSHISSSENVIADTLSHFSSESELLALFPSVLQTQKELSGYRQFHPNADLISCIMDALLHGNCINPTALNKRLLTDPRRTTSCLVLSHKVIDPCYSFSTLQARNFILACYVVSLIFGETLKGEGFFIHHSTLMGYINQAVRCHTNRQLPSPHIGVHLDYVALMTDAVQNTNTSRKPPRNDKQPHDGRDHPVLSIGSPR
jgi:hypothetical protein